MWKKISSRNFSFNWRNWSRAFSATEGALQVSHRRVALDGPERRVVPGEIRELRTLARLGVGLRESHLAPGGLGGGLEPVELAVGDLEKHEGLPIAHELFYGREIRGDRPLERRGEPFVERVVVRDGLAEIVTRFPRWERRGELRPGHLRRQRQARLDDDAVGAVGVEHLQDIRAVQGQAPRLGFDREDVDARHRAGIAQAAVLDRTDAARPAREEPADGRFHVRARVAAQLPTSLARGDLNRPQPRARLAARDTARLDLQDFVHARQIEQDAPAHGNRLAVVARAAPRAR